MVQGSSENYRKSDNSQRYGDSLEQAESYRDVDKDDEHVASRVIRAEINRTRANLERTVEALQGRLDPQAFVHRAFGALRANGGDLASQALQIARRNIVPSALIATGVAWAIVNEMRASS